MHNAGAALDHLLLGVADLDKGIEWVRDVTGVTAAAGGSHPGMGTRNALLSLGGEHYLEIIAPDPAQIAYQFHVDVRGLSEPQLITWAARTMHIEAVAKKARQAGYDVFGPLEGSRVTPSGKRLRWKSLGIQNAFGVAPVEPIPFFIEWAPGSTHPATDSPQGCELKSLSIEHPDAPAVALMLKELGIDGDVRTGSTAHIRATLKTPKGPVHWD